MQAITATELARQTRQILDTVARQGQTIIVERNHVPVARIVPPKLTMTATQALAGLSVALTPRQATAWLADSRTDLDNSVRDSWA
ncbi:MULTISPECIES: type II toxin-antitoxin system Phd/YefM family antitoxin [Burkholderiaceae]|uniref:type II toxin-antitoxin system Phd/YefM family antitoxin n=1 Tax=Burkholderiaceae TaxID=119060 RepID=UPI00095E44D8|nr:MULTISPECIES: type II toxin-antitoxin system Phd/YefM family antitoxin [Burkholderiaceae]MCG1040145.1 type II toxin-antitoxin system Phd/YefM family antitoxin [Mycetohabitans sp. B7]SIT64989.1 Antitoxin Phd_YefM, type II toxin-antitoxin system [Burkholderia sp. b14]